ncbi:isopentenyl-diphosphate Delta-isomerase [Leucobacter chromiireducens]|uniref:Isopentenyl-diphosphate Delta-isomerase n=1 Tax=Leucobacter chromiireducens subsp. solipictus TaxID=398235 RepID=A0ABS1SLB5_9MICO|nr:isopentenyl-diphosphate Delta-isomerase [Leucobacter chromiireducens subsp. solipictus]
MPVPEMVVLLDEQHAAIGSLPKREVHHADTPLHLAFSCYLRNADGEVLLTRRALTKQSWPGVWTNSFCGHPAPNEPLPAAVHRRAADELRAEITDVTSVLPSFRYRATDPGGTVENEFCPVFVAQLSGDITPHPDEVAEWAWIAPAALAAAVAVAPFAFSPWLRAQLPELIAADALAWDGPA